MKHGVLVVECAVQPTSAVGVVELHFASTQVWGMCVWDCSVHRLTGIYVEF